MCKLFISILCFLPIILSANSIDLQLDTRRGQLLDIINVLEESGSPQEISQSYLIKYIKDNLENGIDHSNYQDYLINLEDLNPVDSVFYELTGKYLNQIHNLHIKRREEKATQGFESIYKMHGIPLELVEMIDSKNIINMDIIRDYHYHYLEFGPFYPSSEIIGSYLGYNEKHDIYDLKIKHVMERGNFIRSTRLILRELVPDMSLGEKLNAIYIWGYDLPLRELSFLAPAMILSPEVVYAVNTSYKLFSSLSETEIAREIYGTDINMSKLLGIRSKINFLHQVLNSNEFIFLQEVLK
jgi:hypothetical protein